VRKIAVVTVGRSDFGIYTSVLRAIQAAPELELQIFATGMHLSPDFGLTVEAIEREGFVVHERVETLLAADTPSAIAKATGLGVIGFADVFARNRPDVLIVLGDRFEMYAAALAALPFKIPVAHLHGGEVTHGAIDEALRHSLTKLSHLHFTATMDAARRVQQLGEEPWRVTVSGAPALDALETIPLLSREALATQFGLKIDEPPLLVTFHPVTLQYEQTAEHAAELLAALEESGVPVVLTAPNADTCGRQVRAMMEEFVARYPLAQFVENLGQRGYFSMMREARAMVGNSSSGIIEAASFGLPVVNIGDRQGGRFRGGNVIDTGHRREEILAGIRRALAPEFRAGLNGATNPYRASGRTAAAIIIEHLESVSLDVRLLIKRFQDLIPACP
jgi:UDP-N-acetylglucosamine 2-epimerase (non-hydrolysing)/GDP/UDP-N,N'-diacetylbacillosamine 2-epimerase (hydrolysing)